MVSERIIMQEREKSDCRENHVFFFVLICNSYDVDLNCGTIKINQARVVTKTNSLQNKQ